MSAWPSIACTARRSAPRSTRWVANEWRSLCGDTSPPGSRTPARARVVAQQLPEPLARHRPAALGEEQRALAPGRARSAGDPRRCTARSGRARRRRAGRAASCCPCRSRGRSRRCRLTSASGERRPARRRAAPTRTRARSSRRRGGRAACRAAARSGVATASSPSTPGRRLRGPRARRSARSDRPRASARRRGACTGRGRRRACARGCVRASPLVGERDQEVGDVRRR